MNAINTATTVAKKLFPLLIITAIIAVLCFSVFKLNNDSFVEEKVPVVKGDRTSIFEKALEPIYANAVRITISSVGIDAQIEPVGVAEDGSLDTPKVWKNAGWYKSGAYPGQIGDLLINAHYDDNFGRPAAFWQLKNVNLGDKVSVLDSYGRRYEYEITNYSLVSINDPNRADVFKSDEKSAKITLITCGGVWISGRATYDKRLVIKGELIR